MTINIFNRDNSNMAYIMTQIYQIMAAIAYRNLRFELMTKKPILTNHEFFAVRAFSRINFFT